MISYKSGSDIFTPENKLAWGFETYENSELADIKELICELCWTPSVFDYRTKQGKRLRHRSKDAWLFADFFVLDFDHGNRLQEMIEFCAPYSHIIGTTKSHDDPVKNEKNEDKFRVIIPLETRCHNIDDFEWTHTQAIKKLGSDANCKDGARFYYPCVDIMSFREHGKKKKIIKAPKKKYTAPSEKQIARKRLPIDVLRFLSRGELLGDGRQTSCFLAACKILRYGGSYQETLDMIMNAPINWEKDQAGNFAKLYEWEVERAVKNAHGKVFGKPPSA